MIDYRNAGNAVMLAAVIGATATFANAAVVGLSPEINFGDTPYTVTPGGGTDSFTFADSGQSSGFFDTTLPQVTTSGNAKVASATIFGNTEPSEFQPFSDVVIGPDLPGEFLSYNDDPALFDNAVTEKYIGLQFTLDDGVHYAFARIDSDELFDFAYESEPGVGIQVQNGPFGNDVAPIPLPATLPLLGVGLAGLAGLRKRRRPA